MKFGSIQIALAVAALCLFGCNKKPLPEVNNENCTIENIKKIKDKESRQEFSSLCFRRPGAIQPTEKPLNWLELGGKQHEDCNQLKDKQKRKECFDKLYALPDKDSYKKW